MSKPSVFDKEYGCHTVFERKTIRLLSSIEELLKDIREALHEREFAVTDTAPERGKK